MAMDDSSASNGGGGGTIAAINVTPLVDVMLVLLVIFMVTAPILQQGVSVSLPKVKAAALPGEEVQLVVTVTQDGAVYLNDQRISAEELGPKLTAILKLQPDKQVFLRADQNVRYGEVMRVIAAIKGAGVERLGMVTEPVPEPRRS
jgi:biopolymer transport protein TolR